MYIYIIVCLSCQSDHRSSPAVRGIITHLVQSIMDSMHRYREAVEGVAKIRHRGSGKGIIFFYISNIANL